MIVHATLLLGLATVSTGAADEKTPDAYRVYVGTYTNSGRSKGIYLLELDAATGNLTSKGLVAESADPSFLAIHPSKNFLYAVNELAKFEGAPGGAVSGFAIDRSTGALKPINQKPTKGAAPCHLVVDRTGKNVLAANYYGGSITCLPIDESGKLGDASGFVQHKGTSVDPRRQEAPHAHSINVDAANRFAIVADLGLDKVFTYRFDPDKGTFAAGDPPFVAIKPGSGPRHFAFHPDGEHAYVINEMASTITAFRYHATNGSLSEIQTIAAIPADFHGDTSTADVQVHPSGKFLYGSNRGHDSIAMFRIDPATGKTTSLGNEPTRGKTPRNFGIDPSGRFLLAENQDSDTIVVFKIDQETGRLEATGSAVAVPMPVCVKFLEK
jgi:6-phosphogluconolactonase